MIDLHTHSTASDGSFSPSALIAEAAKRNISVIALTDHDTTGGLMEAAEAAALRNIQFIPGIELEIAWNREGEFHLLGLGIDRPSQAFNEAVEELARRRLERNLEIINRMEKAGIPASYSEISSLAIKPDECGNEGDKPKIINNSIGRPHFAAFLVRRKIVKNREQAFVRYLGKGKPFYIPKIGLEFERAVQAIKESGGIAVLAHPLSLYLSWGRLPDLVKSLKEKGLDGLEAWHPAAKAVSCRRLEELGVKLGLCITAGSDFHGEVRPDRKLGITAGGKKIDEALLEKLPIKLLKLSETPPVN